MYVKLFGSILDSSIWSADLATRVVWITMLAMADEYGMVYASVRGLARRAQVSDRECRRALKILSSPDADDRSGVAGGVRIREFQGAWELLNYKKYRELRSKKQVLDAARQARHRQRQSVTARDGDVTSVTDHDVTVEAEAEAEAEAEQSKSTTLVAAKAATGQALMTELATLFKTQHFNGASREAKVKLIFAYWAAKWDHPQTCLDPQRRGRLAKRLQENSDNVSELLYVVDGAKRDPWDERHRFAGIEQLFKDRGAVEKFAALCPDYGQGVAHPLAVKYGLAEGGSHAVG